MSYYELKQYKVRGRRRGEHLKPEVRLEVSRAGGKARARKLGAEQRREIARKAAAARWGGRGRGD